MPDIGQTSENDVNQYLEDYVSVGLEGRTCDVLTRLVSVDLESEIKLMWRIENTNEAADFSGYLETFCPPVGGGRGGVGQE